jgi:hypothetical protein
MEIWGVPKPIFLTPIQWRGQRLWDSGGSHLRAAHGAALATPRAGAARPVEDAQGASDSPAEKRLEKT